jgi:hypothetical protein
MGYRLWLTKPTTITSTKLVEPLNFKKSSFEKSPLEIFSKLYKQYEAAYLLRIHRWNRKVGSILVSGRANR